MSEEAKEKSSSKPAHRKKKGKKVRVELQYVVLLWFWLLIAQGLVMDWWRCFKATESYKSQ